jgi:hypothetical protein
MRASELNSFVSIRLISAQTWLAGVLILLSFPNAFAESDFSTFWREIKSAIIAGDKSKVAEMTKFPLSMPYLIKAVKNKEDFLAPLQRNFQRRGRCRQCFASGNRKRNLREAMQSIVPSRTLQTTGENAPIRFIFELTKSGWRFAGLDNVNE